MERKWKMSLATVNDSMSERAYELSARSLDAAKARFDNALVRYDAWFLVFVAVILALGATLLIGMAVWCVVYKGKRFTGRWSLRNFGLSAYFECV
jgi:hypothetical protein